MIHSLRIFPEICGMIRHYTKLALVIFPPKNFFLDNMGPIYLKLHNQLL